MSNIEEIREQLDFYLEKRGEVWVIIDKSGVSPAPYISERLWIALAECERTRQYLAKRRNDITGLANEQFVRIQELEAENEKLQKDNERMTRLYYQPQAQEIMHELVQAQRENEQLKSEIRKRDELLDRMAE